MFRTLLIILFLALCAPVDAKTVPPRVPVAWNWDGWTVYDAELLPMPAAARDGCPCCEVGTADCCCEARQHDARWRLQYRQFDRSRGKYYTTEWPIDSYQLPLTLERIPHRLDPLDGR